MKALIKKYKNMSIRLRFMILAGILTILAGGSVIGVLIKNSRTAWKSADYLEHFSQISQIYELNAQNTEALKELKKSDDEQETILAGQITSNINRMLDLLDEVDEEALSSDEHMRVNTVKYLTQYFSNNYSRYLEEEYDNDLYSDCLYTIDRINSFVQEILRISVESNKEYIDRVQKDNTNLWITSVFITIMVVVVSGSINILFSKYIAKIIESTAKMTKEIANGQRTAIYEIKDEPPEVKDMLESFYELLVQLQEKNDMKLKIAQDELEQIRMQELLKEAKLQGLQMQITPHFLFNTLNVISKMAFLENDDKVYHLIIALSKFLRHSLKNRQSCVPIQEEVDMIGQYLYILQARMGNRLHYNIDNQLEKDTTQELPLFTLQPIVENAFKHGVEPCIDGGNIIIRIRQYQEELILTVVDNGVGMDKEQLEKMRLKTKIEEVRFNYEEHIGIENVCSRLNMLYEDIVHIFISSRQGKGTIFTIRIKNANIHPALENS